MKYSTHEIYQQRIAVVLSYIQTHLEEPLLLDQIADIACFSPYHFHHIFHGLVGETLGELIRRVPALYPQIGNRYCL